MATKRIYFAYGSDMWFDQINRRCSDAPKFVGVAKLGGWKWIVGTCGYANIISSPEDVVYGFLYEVQAQDEVFLDRYETQSESSTKLELQVDIVKAKKSLPEAPQAVFLYADTIRKQEGPSKEEHIGRMNKAIAEGIRQGIPMEYFDKYIRRSIPDNWKPEKGADSGSGSAERGDSTVYFGYGSNIWLDQMKRRCPDNKFMGVGKLDKWKWIINTRGYANIIPSSPDVVYGFVFELTPGDERELDTFEGSSYKKLHLPIDLVKAKDPYVTESRTALIYIDTKRLQEGISKKEYVYRINMAIKDGLEEGIPKDYIDKYLRPFIPPLPEDPSSVEPVLAPK